MGTHLGVLGEVEFSTDLGGGACFYSGWELDRLNVTHHALEGSMNPVFCLGHNLGVVVIELEAFRKDQSFSLFFFLISVGGFCF